jgi:hypothetical protein
MTPHSSRRRRKKGTGRWKQLLYNEISKGYSFYKTLFPYRFINYPGKYIFSNEDASKKCTAPEKKE